MLYCAADDVIMMGFLDDFGMSQDLTQTSKYVNIAFHSLSETQAGILSWQAGDSVDLEVPSAIMASAGVYGKVVLCVAPGSHVAYT